jgi:hypothetical protein
MKLLGGIAVAVVATLAALVGVEVALRLLPGGLLDRPGADRGSPYAFYRYDPQLGWSNIPGGSGKLTRAEFSHDVRINSHGLRGPETSREKPPGVRRIAVLGDSFTWGVGATEPELFTSLIEKSLPGVEVLNFGVSGYSPVQHRLLTEKVLSFAPDAVVVVFCLGNDFIDNVHWRRYGYYKPFAALDEQGAVVLDGYPLPYAKRHLEKERGQAFLERSYVFRLLDKTVLSHVRLLNDFGQKGPRLAEDGSDFYRPASTPEVERAVRVNAGLFRAMAAAYAARGIPLLVVAAPTKCELGQCFRDLSAPTDRALRHLQASLAGLEVQLVDPTPDLTLDDFWTHDAHWRPSGHRKIARALIPHVIKVLEQAQPH